MGNIFSQLFNQYNNPQGYAMLGLMLGLIVLLKLMGPSKGKITSGRVAGGTEKMSATRQAMAQLRLRSNYTPPQLLKSSKASQTKPKPKKPGILTEAQKQLPPSRVTLWVGKMPRFWMGPHSKFGAWLQTLTGNAPAVWIPDAQRSALIIGAPGSGKTDSAIDPMIESAISQGIPCLIYDKKGDQLESSAALAARHGYQVHVFAPGESYSGVLNPLDFIRDPSDAVMAGELATVINRNAREGSSGKGDEFFSKAGDLLAKALMQLAKSTEYPDMGMVYSFLRLPGLVHRIDYAVQTGAMDEWIASSFVQFLSAKDAEKTISGILTTATATFSSFIQKDLLRVFVGQSTLPTRIEGKQMIVFKLDDERRSVVGPLLAAAIHLAVVKNLSTPRPDPICVFLDELPSIKLDRLVQWINEYRSRGGCFILGIQSLNQLYEAYGEKLGDSIASACATHMLFYPGDVKTAESYSKRYGEKEIIVRSKSTSHSAGQHSSRSTSYNESLQKMSLFTPDQILRFTEGQCILTNPAYRSGNEGLIPYFLKVPKPDSERARAKQTSKLWETHLRPYLDSLVQSEDGDALMQGLHDRIALADELLPLPPEMVEENPGGVQPAKQKKSAKSKVTVTAGHGD